jgi:hypothetical protein
LATPPITPLLLRWDANTEPDLAGLLSKDDFFFGVRAVDREGNQSPVVFPRP